MVVLGAAIGVALFVVWMLKDCFFRVEEGQVAVVSRFGGALRGPDGKLRTFGPGLHAKWSFDVVHLVSLREQLVTLSGEKGGEPIMLNDGNVIRLDAMMRYHVEKDGLEQYVFGMLHPQEHLTGLFTCLMRNEVANVKAPPVKGQSLAVTDDAGGAYALIRRERQLVNQRIADFARQSLGDRYGVRFNAIDVTDLHPPDELADALNAVMSARAAADELRFRAESECAQRVLSAEKGVAIARLKAEAVEEEMKALGAHLATLEKQGVLDEYVKRRKAEVLADVRTVYLRDDGEGPSAHAKGGAR
ncbi:MAG: SPFH domain-containing protein [Myxococcota bacterium]